MLDQFFPRQIDGTYRGHRFALWLLGVLLFLRLVISVRSIFDGWSVAAAADGIPLDAFDPGAAIEVVYLFAALGLAQLALSLIGVTVLFRYRSAIPSFFALLLGEILARRVVHRLLPTLTIGTPPGAWVTLALTAIIFAGLALSLDWHQPREQRA